MVCVIKILGASIVSCSQPFPNYWERKGSGTLPLSVLFRGVLGQS